MSDPLFSFSELYFEHIFQENKELYLFSGQVNIKKFTFFATMLPFGNVILSQDV